VTVRDEDRPIRLREADLHWQDIDGDVIALEGRASEYLTANPAGALLWRALAAGSTRAELADRLAAAYRLPRARAAHDAERFLAELRERGLLEE